MEDRIDDFHAQNPKLRRERRSYPAMLGHWEGINKFRENFLS